MANFDLVASPGLPDVTRPHLFGNIFCYKTVVVSKDSIIYNNCRLLKNILDNKVHTIFDTITISKDGKMVCTKPQYHN